MEKIDLDQLDPRDYIIIKGAKVNNLKSLSVAIPRNQLVTITGLSGSGKSSLAFDTLFAEGQRMYVESLSAYARQFLGRMEKPEVEYIRGVSPAIAVEQKVSTRNSRSTVGTSTEIYDYLKLLFARIGKTISPISGKIVKKDSVSDVVNFVQALKEGTKLMILCPLLAVEGRNLDKELNILLQKGFTRVIFKEEVIQIEDLLAQKKLPKTAKIQILIDRTVMRKTEEDTFRLADSIQTAFDEGKGECLLSVVGDKIYSFSDRFEADKMTFEEPSINLFSFNNPYGVCKRCEGTGIVQGVDPDLVIPNKNLSVFEGAIACWRTDKMSEWQVPLNRHAFDFDFPLHRSYCDLNEKEKELLWTGNKFFKGLNDFFDFLEKNSHEIKYRVLLSRYRNKIVCTDCKGTRLRKDAGYVKINGKSVMELVLMPISEVHDFFMNIELSDQELAISKRILTEIQNRLGYLLKVGLNYLTLNRLTSTLSGGEFQRIKLATSLGSALVGSMYILDEPSIGLHPRDTQNLIQVLKSLRDMGNTVIVVEHEEEVIKQSDQIIDIGLEAGIDGGNLLFQGTFAELKKTNKGYTARYMNGKESIKIPKKRRPLNKFIDIKNATEHNLKNISVSFPLNTLTVVTGVSGSGKTTLIKKVLYPALMKHMGVGYGLESGKLGSLSGELRAISSVEMIDQNPIGKSSRSNPVTYLRAYDLIRVLYANLPAAKQQGYHPGTFSFNVAGGRCEHCQGEGVVKVEMQFMADLFLTCEHCKGKRFQNEVLEIVYKGKNITDVLGMTVSESLEFFKSDVKIYEKIKPLADVGLGYIKLGQSSTTLSGGEAQRVKLASFLGKGATVGQMLFIFDEPTTGLHVHDIHYLLKAINALVDQGHSVIIIEHNMDMIKAADYIIDLGKEGGHEGGNLCF
ncbi:MAG: excinuclease ABC subunit A, partial [Bacteroidetes bacterium]